MSSSIRWDEIDEDSPGWLMTKAAAALWRKNERKSKEILRMVVEDLAEPIGAIALCLIENEGADALQQILGERRRSESEARSLIPAMATALEKGDARAAEILARHGVNPFEETKNGWLIYASNDAPTDAKTVAAMTAALSEAPYNETAARDTLLNIGKKMARYASGWSKLESFATQAIALMNRLDDLGAESSTGHLAREIAHEALASDDASAKWGSPAVLFVEWWIKKASPSNDEVMRLLSEEGGWGRGAEGISPSWILSYRGLESRLRAKLPSPAIVLSVFAANDARRWRNGYKTTAAWEKTSQRIEPLLRTATEEERSEVFKLIEKEFDFYMSREMLPDNSATGRMLRRMIEMGEGESEHEKKERMLLLLNSAEKAIPEMSFSLGAIREIVKNASPLWTDGERQAAKESCSMHLEAGRMNSKKRLARI